MESPGLFDAHNHLQDARFLSVDVLRAAIAKGVKKMVVNGTAENDWKRVIGLAEDDAVIPSIGLHPWYVRNRSEHWFHELCNSLEQRPCGIGEIGLDRWIHDPDLPAQEEVFGQQLELAARMNLPVTIHCLRAWGRLLEMLRSQKRPACGFLLHSYNGPPEMIKDFLDLGAYFSISGYFAQPRKTRQCETFALLPLDRLLIETDAPDMLLPEELDLFHLSNMDGERINHPGNIGAVYKFVETVLGKDEMEFKDVMEQNFRALFGRLYCGGSSIADSL